MAFFPGLRNEPLSRRCGAERFTFRRDLEPWHSLERLYYSDPFLQEFSATVTDVRGPERGHEGGEAASHSEDRWRVALDRSAFYPSSGGQPSTPACSRPAKVQNKPQSLLRGLKKTKTVLCGTSSPSPLSQVPRSMGKSTGGGTSITCSSTPASTCFRRSFSELDAATVSFHLGADTSTIDLATGPLTPEMLERVERIANELIGEDRPVTIQYAERQEAEALLAAGVLRKLPEREGDLRLIHIEGIDLNACGGTHLRSTGQIGGLLLRRVEKVNRGMRVEFVCGQRAVRTARADAAILNETAGLLSSGAPDVPDAVRRLQADAKAGARERQKLREELATYHGAALVAETPLADGLRLIERGWTDRDRDTIKLLASRTAAAAPGTAVIFTARDADPVRMFVARSADLTFNCGQIVKESLAALGLRGGGSPDLAQGDVPANKEEALRAALTSAIRNASRSRPESA